MAPRRSPASQIIPYIFIMLLFLFTALLVLAAGTAGFFAGVKHAEKARALRAIIEASKFQK